MEEQPGKLITEKTSPPGSGIRERVMQYTSSNFQTGKIAHCHGSSVCTKVLNSVVVVCTSPLSAAIYVRKFEQFLTLDGRWAANKNPENSSCKYCAQIWNIFSNISLLIMLIKVQECVFVEFLDTYFWTQDLLSCKLYNYLDKSRIVSAITKDIVKLLFSS